MGLVKRNTHGYIFKCSSRGIKMRSRRPKGQAVLIHMLATAEPSAQNDLENAAVDVKCVSPSRSSVLNSQRGNGNHVHCCQASTGVAGRWWGRLFGWALVVSTTPNTASPDLTDLVAEFKVGGEDKTTAIIRPRRASNGSARPAPAVYRRSAGLQGPCGPDQTILTQPPRMKRDLPPASSVHRFLTTWATWLPAEAGAAHVGDTLKI